MTLGVTDQILSIAVAISLSMLLLWLQQLRTGDAGVVDIGWSFGLGAAAVFVALTSDGQPLRRLLLGLIAGSWAFRLGSHLWQRNRGRQEDGRYRELRRWWGDRAQLYLFILFQFQALLVVLFSVPYLVVAHNPLPFSIWDILGVAVFVAAIAGETVADRQLERFRSRPENKGRTCRRGLWRYSRHPNYFFEWVHWWSYVLLALGAPWGWAALSGPLLMLLFLFRITGIPATERQALRSRGEDYRQYQESTSAFFPWFPKSENS